MLQVLEGSGGDVLGVEISREYTKADGDQFQKAFEETLAHAHGRINMLVKMDQLPWSEVRWDAFMEDARYALHNREKMRHLAIVGDRNLEEEMIMLDKFILGKPEGEQVKKYFDVSEIDQAWAFVRS